jgi:hypothetical protein
MIVNIETSDPGNVNPAEIASALSEAGWFVTDVNVNDGERVWNWKRDAK